MCLSGQYTGSSTRIICILCGCVMSASNYNRRGLYRCQYILQPEGKCLNYVTLVVPEWLGKVQTVTSYINSLGKSVHLWAYGMVSLTFKFDCSFYDPPPPNYYRTLGSNSSYIKSERHTQQNDTDDKGWGWHYRKFTKLLRVPQSQFPLTLDYVWKEERGVDSHPCV